MVEKTKHTRVAAYGLIVLGDEILLCRLSDQVPSHKGKWTLPGGGIEFGESPAEAMIREVEEETGLVVDATSIAGINSMTVESDEARRHNIRILFHASVVSGTLRNETSGTTDRCQWWKRSELPKLVGLAEYGIEIAFAK